MRDYDASAERSLIVAIISQAIEDALALRRNGIIDADLQPIQGRIKNSRYDQSFVLETCKFFGKPLEVLLDVAAFTLEAKTIRRKVGQMDTESKAFQHNCINSMQTICTGDPLNSGEISKKLNKCLYGSEKLVEGPWKSQIQSEHKLGKQKHKKQNESPKK